MLNKMQRSRSRKKLRRVSPSPPSRYRSPSPSPRVRRRLKRTSPSPPRAKPKRRVLPSPPRRSPIVITIDDDEDEDKPAPVVINPPPPPIVISIDEDSPPAPLVLPQPSPQLTLREVYDKLQLLSIHKKNKKSPSMENEKQNYENALKLFLRNEEVKSLQTAKLCLSRQDFDRSVGNCTADPDFLLRKELLNDKKLVDFYQNHRRNRDVIITLETHGYLISERDGNDVNLRAYQVPPGCSVTIISLTKPGLFFYHYDKKNLSVDQVAEKLIKEGDFTLVDLTRFLKYICQQFFKFVQQEIDISTRTDENRKEKCRLFKNGIKGFSGDVVALTYTEGEYLLDKNLEVFDPSEIEERKISKYNWNITVQELNGDPFFFTEKMPISTTLSAVLESTFSAKGNSNVLVMDKTCSSLRHGFQNNTIEDYLAFVQQQCSLVNLRGGRKRNK